MRTLMCLLLVLLLGATLAQSTDKDFAKEKAAAGLVFQQIDEGLMDWGWKFMEESTPARMNRLKARISIDGVKIVQLMPEIKTVGGKKICAVEQLNFSYSPQAFIKAIDHYLWWLKIDRFDTDTAMAKANTETKKIYSLMECYIARRGGEGDEKVLPFRKSVDRWEWPLGYSFSPKPKTPLIYYVKLKKEAGGWRLSEIQVVSFEKFRL